MTQPTKIQWCDVTWNPVRGCRRVSPWCENCYAEAMAARFDRPGLWGDGLTRNGRWNGRVVTVPEKLAEPMRMRKPRRIFVNSTSDLFHEDVPDDYIAAVFGVMAACPQHTFLVLTKRAERMEKWFEWMGTKSDAVVPGQRAGCGATNWCMWFAQQSIGSGDFSASGIKQRRMLDPRPHTIRWPLPNVHLGVSVESQDQTWRIEHLLRCPAAVRWVSAEPLLGPLDLHGVQRTGPRVDAMDGVRLVIRPRAEGGVTFKYVPCPKIDWVVVGGESGTGARPCDVEWIGGVVEQCREAGVPVFVKQDSGPRAGMQGRISDEVWAMKEYPR